MLAPQITTSTGKTGIPGSLCKAMGAEARHMAMAHTAAAVSLHKATKVQEGPSLGPIRSHLQGGHPMSLQRLPLRVTPITICIGAKGLE